MMGPMKGQNPMTMMRMHGPSPGYMGPQSGPGMEDPNMMGPGNMGPNGPYNPGGPGPRMMAYMGQGCGNPHPHHHPHPGHPGSMGPGYGPGGPGGMPGSMMDEMNEMMMNQNHMNQLSSSQIPDENLTPEQRQHRSKGLAQLTKIHQMLLGGSGPQDGRQQMGPNGPHPGEMYPGGPPGMMTSQQQAMMSQQQAMMSQGGMMPPHGMMGPQGPPHMMQPGMSPYGPRGPPGMPPGMNGKDQVMTGIY